MYNTEVVWISGRDPKSDDPFKNLTPYGWKALTPYGWKANYVNINLLQGAWGYQMELPYFKYCDYY